MVPTRLLLPLSLLPLAALALIPACASGQKPKALPNEHFTPPAKTATTVTELPGVHNIVTYDDNLLSGGAPEDEAGMRSLAGLGIKTIISVDGMLPDVELAEKYGMRYVHLPISYDKVPVERQKELAQAITSCGGPIYMHCHHGKHRSAAALASAVVLCGKLTPEAAMARMSVSGTAKDYQGLWQSVRNAAPLPADQLRIDPDTLPKLTQASGMVSLMNEIDQVFDFVKRAQKAGWKAPADHPDLVASHETERLAAAFARVAADQECVKEDSFLKPLDAAIIASKQLDAAVRANDAATADQLVTTLGKSCKECHKTYRDS